MRGTLVALILIGSLLLAGCVEGDDDKDDDGSTGEDQTPGGGNNTTAPPANVTLQVSLSGAYPVSIAYEPARLEVAEGSNVTVVFTNDDQNPVVSHDWVLEDVDGAATEVIGNGATSEVTFPAPAAGTYAFYCSVPGHRGNGMEGEFVVA